MRYLRMLSNAIIAGVAGAAYLTVLFLQLNPGVRLYPAELGPLFGTLAVVYGAHLAVMSYGLIVLRQLFAAKVVSPGWISLRVLAWLFSGAALGGAALMWANLRSFGPMLEPGSAGRMAAGAASLTGAALAILVIALVHYSLGRPATAVGAAVFGLTVIASVALPVTARGPGAEAPLESRPLGADIGFSQSPGGPRVTMVLLDGASLDFVSSQAVEGRLPHFGRILDGGAAMHLATLRPTQPYPVWTSVATGKLPYKTGIRASARYRIPYTTEPLELLPDGCFAQGLVQLGLLTEIAHTSASPRARPIWSILGGAGLSSGIVAWPLTHPAQPVRGFLVTDEFYKQDTLSVDPDDPAAVYPPDQLNPARVAAAAASSEPPSGRDQEAVAASLLPAELRRGPVLASDRLYESVARRLDAASPARFTAVRYRLIDEAGHGYLRYAMPRAFGDVTEDERRRYGRVLEGAYTIVDGAIGRALASLRPGDLLLVVSGFGMEPLRFEKLLLERAIGDRNLSGTHEAAPDGFMLAFGAAVAPGRKPRASVVDVAPTVLYFLGLPVARDMDGFARSDVFKPEFTERLPMTFIPTYDR